MNNSSPQQYRLSFGQFTLNIDQASLEKMGTLVALRPKSFEVLRYLVEHHGRLVTRQELLDAVWHDVIVTDDSLTQCVTEIRKALDDHSQKILRTVPRRGYIIDVAVRETVDDADLQETSPPGARRRARTLASAVALVSFIAVAVWWGVIKTGNPKDTTAAPSPTPNSIAVLRFADMSPRQDQAYLAEGFPEEIIHRLVRVPSLHVIARTSSFAVDGDTVADIAARLNVAHVLEGSVRKDGDMIRITAQLVDVTTSAHIWSRTYDRNLDDIFEVQTEIADAVALAFNASLLEKGSATPPGRAYDLFLQGKFYYLRRAPGDLDKAAAYYEEALAIDPEFARAWVGIAAIANIRLISPHSDRVVEPAARSDVLEHQRYAVERALKFGPALPEAHMRAASYYWHSNARELASIHVDKARSLDPNHWLVVSLLANRSRRYGRIEESVEMMRSMVRRDPMNELARNNLATILMQAGRYQEALTEYRSLVEFRPPTSDGDTVDESTVGLGHALINTGSFDEALAWIEAWPQSREKVQALSLVYHALGRNADADNELEQLITNVVKVNEARLVAEAYVYLDRPHKSVEWLEKIPQAPDCSGRDTLVLDTYYSPYLAHLGDDIQWRTWKDNVEAGMKNCEHSNER